MKPKFSISPYSIISYVFFGAVVFLSFYYYKPVELESHPKLAWQLLRASPHTFIVPASPELGPVRGYLPERGTISLITDEPFGKDPVWTRFHHDAENYLCPLVLNKKPAEKTAAVYCSTSAIAEKRLAETGYRWQKRVTPSSGTAVKIE